MSRLRFLGFTALLTSLGLTGCDNPAVRQRTEDIQRLNEALDRKCTRRAIQHVRKRWLVDGDSWFGKMPDGSIVKLSTPVFAVEPQHQGKPFYSGWLGDVVLSAVKWETRPVSNTRAVFSIRYRATFKDVDHCTLEIVEGPKVERADPADLLAFEEAEAKPDPK